ncbi:MAG TPA: ArsI/CadI family heavy metal resistance metalloenzyme [Gaiellales bacterium]|nr:ArsI/CadI family heavy metal resistance metalloenzyme [Gaiellales bacterium]
MSNTFHLSLDVPDLDRAIAFYEQLFGEGPAKRKPGYAKFELADPPVALALQRAERPALSHLGIRVGATEQVEAAGIRLRRSGLVTLDERDTSCCYARQDKVWVADPAGNRWEVYTVLGDIEDGEHKDDVAAACCTPIADDPSACCA